MYKNDPGDEVYRKTVADLNETKYPSDNKEGSKKPDQKKVGSLLELLLDADSVADE